MPRRRSPPPRLYLDRIRKQWLIRDGALGIRTGCPETNRVGAEKRLAEYLASKHKPEPSADPLIADILLAYSNGRRSDRLRPRTAPTTSPICRNGGAIKNYLT